MKKRIKKRKKAKVVKKKRENSNEEFKKKVKDFLGNTYTRRLWEYNTENERRYRGFNFGSSPDLKDLVNGTSKLLPIFDVKKLLKKEKVSRLRKFYSDNLGEGSSKLSKRLVVQAIVDACKGKVTTDFQSRKSEEENIDTKYINATTEFFELSGVTVPRVILLEILSFLRYNYDLIEQVGVVNSSYYLLILSSWRSTVPVNLQSLYKISSLIFQSMKRFEIGANFTTKESKYLMSKISENRIEEIIFHCDCSLIDIKNFLNFLNRNEIFLSNCRTLRFGHIELSKHVKTRTYQIPSSPFPNLQKIDNLQNSILDISQLKTVDHLILGSTFFENSSLSKYRFIFAGEEHNNSVVRFSNIDYTSNPWRDCCEVKIEKGFFSLYLFDQGRNIRTICVRIKMINGYYNFHLLLEHLIIPIPSGAYFKITDTLKNFRYKQTK